MVSARCRTCARIGSAGVTMATCSFASDCVGIEVKDAAAPGKVISIKVAGHRHGIAA